MNCYLLFDDEKRSFEQMNQMHHTRSPQVNKENNFVFVCEKDLSNTIVQLSNLFHVKIKAHFNQI